MFKQSTAPVIAGMIALGLAACGSGGGGDEDEEDDGPADASAAGIWSGTYRLDGQTDSGPMFGLVTEEGDFSLVAIGNASRPTRVFFGTGTTSGNSFSANAISYSSSGKTPSSLEGTVTDRAAISGSYSLTGESATLTLTYKSSYERTASFETLSGVYELTIPDTATSPGGTISVDVTANGSFTYTVSASGCTIMGAFTIPHSNRNYYRLEGTAAGCGAADGPVSGTAYLDDNTAGDNRVLILLGQNEAQTAALFALVSK